MIDALREWAGLDERSYLLRIPRAEENEGILLLGDPGTGKSQIIHQILGQIERRQPTEAVVCYDPACEFVEAHYEPRHDVILNPLDQRSPYWSPSQEINFATPATSATDRQLIAESFFPDREHSAPSTQFFIKAARSIFGRMLEFRLTAEEIVRCLQDDKAIDEVVAGTEHAHLIDKEAKGQRGGVLATLSEIGEVLKLLPASEECRGSLSLTEWTKQRRGWIFITSTQDTREALRPLHAAWINILMKRLMAVDRRWASQHPCWVVVDEVHSLRRLPSLAMALVEGRKYGIKMVLGTQNKAQFEEHNGRGAATMLASPHLKILLRCNEPESARWVAEMIGEQETEKPRIGTTATVEANGRDSINYSTHTERRAVVSKEQVMALPNLHGYWKHGDAVVPFRIKPENRPQIARGFVARDGTNGRPAVMPPHEEPLPSTPAQQRPPEARPPGMTSGEPAAKDAQRPRQQELDDDGINLTF